MKLRIIPLSTVIIAVFTVGFSWGIIIPVTSVILEARHIPTPIIGITATAIFVGMALSAPFIGRSIELYGVKRTLFAGMFGAGVLMIALALWTSIPVWIALRFIIGIAFGAITTSCETLINRVSTERNRGRNLGFYAFAFSLSLMIAPIALWLLKFGVWAPFVTGGVICFAATLLVSITIPHVREEIPESSFDLHLVRRITLSLTTNFMAGFMEGALIALIPVYALRQSFNTGQTGMLLFAFMLGHGGGPPLIGILADRVGLRLWPWNHKFYCHSTFSGTHDLNHIVDTCRCLSWSTLSFGCRTDRRSIIIVRTSPWKCYDNVCLWNWQHYWSTFPCSYYACYCSEKSFCYFSNPLYYSSRSYGSAETQLMSANKL